MSTFLQVSRMVSKLLREKNNQEVPFVELTPTILQELINVVSGKQDKMTITLKDGKQIEVRRSSSK